ncbi:hypothetical protein bcgnr5378_08470 [Bacillus cereus]|nr:hypothetical protein [Bacillus cereus]HDR8329620.1 hypothetical protein [Bacillus cereus]HDR8336310.1 hypothetical protein [Bacillus cereus]
MDEKNTTQSSILKDYFNFLPGFVQKEYPEIMQSADGRRVLDLIEQMQSHFSKQS